MDAYSSSKAAWHTDKIEALRRGEHIVPSHVHLIISDLCNQDCHFCAYRMSGGFSTEQFAENGNHNPNRMIPTGKVKEIIDDLAKMGVKAVQFTGGGEPTVHPDCGELLAYAQREGLQTALVTNGTRLGNNHMGHATLAKLDWLRISLDAGTAETYAKVRQSKLWDKAIIGLQIAGQLGGPRFGVGFVITRENWREIEPATEIARRAGASYIRFAAMFGDQGSAYYGTEHESLVGSICERLKRAKRMQDDSFEVVDLFTHRLGDLDQGSPDYEFCGYQRFTVYIGGDQKVYRCCTTSYTKHGEIGDLKNQSFAEWWRDYSYEGFDARSCHHCQFNAQNKAINYMLGEPEHVNFV